MSNASALAVSNEQGYWDDKQLAALSQLGLSGAPKGDLAVFLHYSQRTGLDPFARQIYMINRGGRYTIQTSIDGFRIVAQRSGNYGGQTSAEWCGEDGIWKDVWLSKTPPAAAKIGVYYKDAPNPTYATAKWDSYAQSSPIWTKMPDLMLAKCAESLALRKAFPNDLSGVYTAEEMEQAEVSASPVLTVVELPKQEPIRQSIANEELTVDLIKILDEVDNCKTVEALKALFTRHGSYLDYSFQATPNDSPTMLRGEIMARKAILETIAQ